SVTSSDSSRPQERALAQSDTDGLSGSPHRGAREACKGLRVNSEGALEPSRLNSVPKPGFGIWCCLLPLQPGVELYRVRHRERRLCSTLLPILHPFWVGAMAPGLWYPAWPGRT